MRLHAWATTSSTFGVTGAYLGGRRFGGAGITFAGPWVTLSQAGNVYLRTGWSGSVDLGGGELADLTDQALDLEPSESDA